MVSQGVAIRGVLGETQKNRVYHTCRSKRGENHCFLFSVLTLAYSSHLGLSGLLAPSPELRESTWLPLGFHLCNLVWKLSQGNNLGQAKYSSHLFPIFQELLSFIAWCSVSWETFFSYVLSIFWLFKYWINLVLVMPAWLETTIWSISI